MLNRCLYLFILKCYIFLKSLLNFFTILLLFCVWLSGQEACGILAPQLGTEPASSALGGEVLTSGLREKSTLSRSVLACSLCLKCLSLYPENSNSVFKTQFKQLCLIKFSLIPWLPPRHRWPSPPQGHQEPWIWVTALDMASICLYGCLFQSPARNLKVMGPWQAAGALFCYRWWVRPSDSVMGWGRV